MIGAGRRDLRQGTTARPTSRQDPVLSACKDRACGVYRARPKPSRPCPSTTTRCIRTLSAEREKALMEALPQQIAHAKANAPFFAKWLKDVDAGCDCAALPGRRCCGDAGRGAEEESTGGLITAPMSAVLHVARPILRSTPTVPDYFPAPAPRMPPPSGPAMLPTPPITRRGRHHDDRRWALAAPSCRRRRQHRLQLDAIAIRRPAGSRNASFLKIRQEGGRAGRHLSLKPPTSAPRRCRPRRARCSSTRHDLPAELRHADVGNHRLLRLRRPRVRPSTRA